MVVGALTAPSNATTTLVHALVGAAVPLAVACAMRVHKENAGAPALAAGGAREEGGVKKKIGPAQGNTHEHGQWL
jgi:hypothetical protein